jgi:hypothetical protein
MVFAHETPYYAYEHDEAGQGNGEGSPM